MTSAADEMVTIVDEHNQVVGSATRREMRARKLSHRSTYILVFNALGEIFVQKRTATKDVFAGYYDVVAGGVVLAAESYEDGAKRELEEELGIRGIPLRTLFDFYFVDQDVRVWGRAFSCIYNGEMTLQEEEIESGEFMPLRAVLARAKTERYTPDGMYVLYRLIGRADDQ
jgi:8-oxo-dGTP pyrophosphatase MutT (NUDIX family)